MILYNDYAFQCSNSGTITGRISVGGIAGHTHTDATISNCINIGTVRGSISVGGIAAGFDNYGFGFYEDELSGSVNNCHNAGLVIGSDYVGGIQSYCWGGEITNSLNTGVVVGYSNTGSITGKIT